MLLSQLSAKCSRCEAHTFDVFFFCKLDAMDQNGVDHQDEKDFTCKHYVIFGWGDMTTKLDDADMLLVEL